MSRGIKLTPEFQENFIVNAFTGFRLRVTASEANGLSDSIFLYVARPPVGAETESQGVIMGVCSAADMADWPDGAPEPNAVPAWYRRAVLDVVCPSRIDADLLWARIQKEVEVLIESLNATDELAISEPVVIGDLASSSSSSEEP